MIREMKFCIQGKGGGGRLYKTPVIKDTSFVRVSSFSQSSSQFRIWNRFVKMIYYTKYGLDDVRQTKKKMKKSKKEGIVYRVSFFF